MSKAPQEMSTETYRTSHAEDGYGKKYEQAYENSTYYGQLWNSVEREIVRHSFQQVKDSGASSYLDFACGTGRVLQVGKEVFANASGVDISSAMLEVAQQKCPDEKLYCQDITSAPLDGKFDVISAFRFFRNAEPSLQTEALRAMQRHLNPNGFLVANIHGNPLAPSMWALKCKAMISRVPANTISRGYFTRLLEKEGFEVVSTVDYSYLPRIGSFYPGWYSKLMNPAESVCKRLPLVRGLGESTLFVAKSVQS